MDDAHVMNDARVPDAVRRYFAAVNDRDFEVMPDLFAEDAELRPVGSAPLEGRDAIVTYYPEILSGFAEGYDDPRRAHVADTAVTVEIAFTGRTREGRDVAFDAVDVFELDGDGRIRRLSLWYDTLDVARQVRGPRR